MFQKLEEFHMEKENMQTHNDDDMKIWFHIKEHSNVSLQDC